MKILIYGGRRDWLLICGTDAEADSAHEKDRIL